jgi:hypothetical protein
LAAGTPSEAVTIQAIPTFLRLVQRDDQVPLLLTLCDEHGNEIDSTRATGGDAAIRMAIRLLARTQTLRPGYRLMVSMENALATASHCILVGHPAFGR